MRAFSNYTRRLSGLNVRSLSLKMGNISFSKYAFLKKEVAEFKHCRVKTNVTSSPSSTYAHFAELRKKFCSLLAVLSLQISLRVSQSANKEQIWRKEKKGTQRPGAIVSKSLEALQL